MKTKILLCLVLFAAMGGSAFGQNNARMLSIPNAQTGTTYTFVAADTTRVVTFNNASPVAVSLPNGATFGFGAGTMLSVMNLGAGQVTITCSSCTINGVATLVLSQNSGADIYGGTGTPAVNYVALPSPTGANFAGLGANNAFTGNNTSAGTFAESNAGVFTNTQMNEYLTSSINGLNFQTEFQAGQGNQSSTDGAAFGVKMPNGASVLQSNGMAGYVLNQATGGAGVGVYGQGRCVAPGNGARCWGSNVVATDFLGTTSLNSQTSSLIGEEVDVDPANVGDGSIGVLSLLNSSVFVANSLSFTGGNAFLAGGNYRANNILWNTGFATQDAGASIFANAGATCLSGTCPSQPLQFRSFNGGPVITVNVLTDTAGNLQLNVPSGDTVVIPAGAGVSYREGSAPLAAATLDVVWGDSAVHRLKMNNNNGSPDVVVGANTTDTFANKSTAAGPLTGTVASATTTLTSGSVGAASCQTAVTTTAVGAQTTDTITWAYATAPSLTTDALLTIAPYVTSGFVNFTRCNPTAGAIVGTAIVINWRVIR